MGNLHIPPECAMLIAEFIPPNPAVYIRLSKVCNSFFYAFTQDRLWRSISPYGMESAIAERYKEDASRDEFVTLLWDSIDIDVWDSFHDVSELNPPPILACLLGLVKLDEFTSRYTVMACAIYEALYRDRGVLPLGNCILLTEKYIGSISRQVGNFLARYLAHSKLLQDAIGKIDLTEQDVPEETPLICHYLWEADDDSIAVMLTHFGLALKCMSEVVKDTKSLVKLAVRSNGSSLNYTSRRLRNDPEIVLIAVSDTKKSGPYGEALSYASWGLRNNRQIVLEAIKHNSFSFEFASARFRHDREVVYAAVLGDGHALQYASSHLCDDKLLVLEAVSKCGTALRFASRALRGDYEVVYTAIKNDSTALEFASSELRNDWNLVYTSLLQNPASLEFASKRLRNNKRIVLTAVRRYDALEYASERLRNDFTIVRRAIEFSGLALMCCSKELCNDKSLVLSAVSQKGAALMHVSPRLQCDREVVLAAVASYGLALEYASPQLCDDKEVVLAAVQSCGSSIRFASKELRDDWDVALAAVNNDGSALVYVSYWLRNEYEIVLAAVKNDFIALHYASAELRSDRELVELTLRMGNVGEQSLLWHSKELRNDPLLVLQCVGSKGYAHQKSELFYDRDFVLVAFKHFIDSSISSLEEER